MPNAGRNNRCRITGLLVRDVLLPRFWSRCSRNHSEHLCTDSNSRTKSLSCPPKSPDLSCLDSYTAVSPGRKRELVRLWCARCVSPLNSHGLHQGPSFFTHLAQDVDEDPLDVFATFP